MANIQAWMTMNAWVMIEYKATILGTRVWGQPKRTDIVEYFIDVVMVQKLRYPFGTEILEAYWILPALHILRPKILSHIQ